MIDINGGSGRPWPPGGGEGGGAPLLLVLLVLASCSRPQPVPSPTTRIISAAPSNTEIIAALGLADHLIAVDRWSKDVEGVPADLPEVDLFYPDVEAIIGMDPDVIVANEINNFGAADSPFKPLREMGITTVQIPASASLAGICGDIMTIARALGVEERGAAVVTAFQAEVEKIAAIGRTVTARRSVYFEVTGAPFVTTCGGGTYLNEMLEIIGAVNIFGDVAGWFSPGAEAIIVRDPEVILTMAMTDDGVDPVTELLTRPGFEVVSAVAAGRVYAVDADAAGRASPRVTLALAEMARAVYPEWYGDE